MRRSAAILAWLTLAHPVTTAPSPAGASPSPASVKAVRLIEPVTIDGVLSDPAWSAVPATDAFRQREPEEGAEPTLRTEVRVAYDDQALYVAARLYDPAPDSILARLSRRDVPVTADHFTLFLDPYRDRRSGYYFAINAAGTLYDGTMTNDGWEDGSWDGVWQGRARVDAEGWTVEMQIPFSQVRFAKQDEHVWGINFYRAIPRRSEHVFLVYRPRQGSAFISLFPELTGLARLRPGRAVELRPYVTSRAEFLQHAPGDPFIGGAHLLQAAGGDLRANVASNLTLNLTAKPDFGQVEVDPAVVNLSDVETFFQEKRPFFVEGASIFGFGNQGAANYMSVNWPEPRFFYSRRVGRAPQGLVPAAEFRHVPVGTDILGAAKLTGRLAPGLDFGTVHAVTAREFARLRSAGVHSRSEVEPLTYYGIVRGLKEFAGRRTGLGALTTLAARSFADPRLRDQLNGESVAAGVDGWRFLDARRVWVVSGWSAMTHVRGTPARMVALQRHPRHYFQRPDAGHVAVDATATSLTGHGGRYWLNKQQGAVLFNAAAGYMTPKFDVADLGFMNHADLVNAHVMGGYQWTRRGRVREYQNVHATVYANADHAGNRTATGVIASAFTEFNNKFSWHYRAGYRAPALNNRRTRGGPLTVEPAGVVIGTYFDTDGRAKRFYSIDADLSATARGTTILGVGPAVEWKPAGNVHLRLGPRYTRSRLDAQWVGAIADPTATATYGRRYVFAHLDQTTVSADLRLNWTFRPTLSLELFAQPLVSSGDYDRFKELARSRSYDFTPVGGGPVTYDPVTGLIDFDGPGPGPGFSPDFTFRSLRGNAVMRWEYRPGSTLFLVWTQQRAEGDNDGLFRLSPSLGRLVRAEADNIFLAKLTYYFTL